MALDAADAGPGEVTRVTSVTAPTTTAGQHLRVRKDPRVRASACSAFNGLSRRVRVLDGTAGARGRAWASRSARSMARDRARHPGDRPDDQSVGRAGGSRHKNVRDPTSPTVAAPIGTGRMLGVYDKKLSLTKGVCVEHTACVVVGVVVMWIVTGSVVVSPVVPDLARVPVFAVAVAMNHDTLQPAT